MVLLPIRYFSTDKKVVYWLLTRAQSGIAGLGFPVCGQGGTIVTESKAAVITVDISGKQTRYEGTVTREDS